MMNYVIKNQVDTNSYVLIQGAEYRTWKNANSKLGTISFVGLFDNNPSNMHDGWYRGGTIVLKTDIESQTSVNEDWFPIHLIRKSEVEAFYDYYVTMVINGYEVKFEKEADCFLWSMTEIFPEYVILSHSGYTLELTDIQKEILKTIPQSEVIEKSGGSHYDGYDSYTFIPKRYIEKIILRRRYLKTDNIEKSLKKEYTGKEDVYELDLKNPDPDILSLMEKKGVICPYVNLSIYKEKFYFKEFVERHNIRYEFIDGSLFMQCEDFVIIVRLNEENEFYGEKTLFCSPSEETVYYCEMVILDAAGGRLDPFPDNIEDISALKHLVFGCPVDSEEYKKKHKDSVESRFVEMIYLLDRFIYGNDKLNELEIFKKPITVNKEFYRVHKSEFDQFLNGKQLDKSDNK